MHPRLQSIHPHAKPVLVAIHVQDARASTVNQETAEVRISSLADAQQGRFAARGILGRCKPQPGCHVSSSSKVLALADGSDERFCGQLPDAGVWWRGGAPNR